MLLQGLMHNYLNESNMMSNFMENPIKVKKSSWIVSEDKLKIVYEFELNLQKEAFCIEILKYLREKEVDIEFRARENKVAIIIHAYSSQISNLEIEASKDIDKIKRDTVYYYAKKD